MPAGYVPEGSDTVHLDWDEVQSRLVAAVEYWLASTSPDGSPHVVPRWGVWLDGAFWYDGSPDTRHARNVEARHSCALHLESGWEAVIVYGESLRSAPVTGELGVRLAAEFSRKYSERGYEPEPTSWSDEIAGGLRRIAPATVLAWTSFPTDLTRFSFDAAS